ncbi:MAG TPA: hypothetical protein VGL22_13540 [Terracidiphilus sp.]
MSRIVFDNARPVVESDPARTDVACFVGLARATGAALPDAIVAWLQLHGWTNGSNAQPGPTSRSINPPFTDIPIPIESYATFTALFDPGGSNASFGTDYLAAAVRSFFAQGGRRCYVVSMGDPLGPTPGNVQPTASDKAQKLDALLPRVLFSANDRRNWHGIGHLGGLPDVSILAVPDLPLLSASDSTLAQGVPVVVEAGPSQFVECSQVQAAGEPNPVFPLPAPRLSPADYDGWSASLQTILQYLAQAGIREITLVAAFPLPQHLDPAAASENPSSPALAADIHDAISKEMPENIQPDATTPPPDAGLSTAFLQLGYPWLRTTGSYVLNESLEPPDGALAGLLACNALTRGAFMDAVKVVPAEIVDIWPSLPGYELSIPVTPPQWGDGSWKPLIMRLSIFGFTPSGLRLLSDVTAYPGEAYRPARVHRLVGVISRAARQLGERSVFQNNGPQLWRRVEISLTELMTRLWRMNALEGASTDDAFSVRCDRSTMTQNDLDNGRMVAQVTFTAASTIELIRVTLALETSGAAAQGSAVLAGVS